MSNQQNKGKRFVCAPSLQSPPRLDASGSKVAEQVRAFYNDLSEQAGVITPAKQLEQELARDYGLLVAAAAHMPVLTNYSRVSNVLAKALGWKSLLWQAPSGALTEAGAVRQLLVDKSKQAGNLLKYTALMRVIPEVNQLQRTLKQTFPTIPAAQLQELVYDQVVVGQLPKLLEIYDSPVVIRQLEARYSKHISRLQELGASTTQIEALDNLAGSISAGLDIVRGIAAREGMTIESISNAGLFPIQVRREVQRLLDDSQPKLQENNSLVTDKQLLENTRTTGTPIVLDDSQLGYVFGMSEHEFADILVQPGAFSDLLRKLPDEQVEALYESGVLANVPATSDELTQFYNEALDLNIRNLGEAIVLDPEQAIAAYSRQLEETVQASALVKTLVTDGVDNGWLVSASRLTQEELKNYQRLGNSAYLRDYLKISNADNLSELMVHKTVATQLEAVIRLNTSWADLSVIGQMWQGWTRFFRTSALLATGGVSYVQRVFVNNSISLYAATGTLGELMPATADVFRWGMKRSEQALDNTRTFATIGGKQYTLRELFRTTMLARGTDFTAALSENVSRSFSGEARKLAELGNFWRFTYEYNKRVGSPFTGAVLTAAETAQEAASATYNAAYGVLAANNQMLDFSARWAAVRTLATDSKKNFSNMSDLLRYTDEYFGIQEDAGSFGRAYGSVGMPFASFALVAPGSALRHAIRNPWRAGRVGLLYAQAAKVEQLTKEEQARYQRDSYVIHLFTDPNTGKRYSLMPSSVDFYLESALWFRNIGNSVRRSLGLPTDNKLADYDATVDGTKVIQDALVSLADKTYAYDVLKPALDLERRYDSYDRDTVFGFSMPKQWRDTIANAFPIIRGLEQLPGVGGKKQQRNTITGLSSGGIPGLGGSIPTSGGIKSQLPNDNVTKVASLVLGLSIQEVDPEQQLFSSYKDIGVRKQELAKMRTQVEKQTIGAVAAGNSVLVQELADEVRYLGVLNQWLDFQQWRIRQLQEQRGYTDAQAIEAIRSATQLPNNKLQEQIDFSNYLLQQQQGAN